MKIAITGSSGFIGSSFIKNNSEFEILEVDLISNMIEDIDLNGIDSVLHLAAIVHQTKGTEEDIYFKVNRDLAYETAKQAKSCGVKQFILMSTVKVYGESTDNSLPWNEKSICKPEDAYGRSKLEAEKLIKELEDDLFKVAIIRSPLVYGAGVKANMNNLIRLIDKFRILPLGGINNRRSIVYIGNLIALIHEVINRRTSGVYIPSDKNPLSTTQLCKIIAGSIEKRVYFINVPIIVQKYISKIAPSIGKRLFGSLEVNCAKTNEFLGFEPPFSTEQGILEMIKWYKEK